jgi:predicted TIM-barrel fold metal-dependent hydrolase
VLRCVLKVSVSEAIEGAEADMGHRHLVVDADSHKCENPAVFFDYIPSEYRDRISLVRDRYGEQRFELVDCDPATGRPELRRVFPQIDGLGKGTYRPYHEETTIGGLFNRVRLEHMDREGIDHQVIYGSMPLSFGSLIDPELAVVLCQAYNDYIFEDCASYADRLHPVAVLPLQDPVAAVSEMRRCVEGLGMVGVSIPPNLPVPHPAAPEQFPEIRIPKALSDADFLRVYEEAERLDVGIGIHGAPGMQLAGGCSDQIETFTLVHVFANRNMQQMAMAKLIFDGVLEAFPRARFGFLEAGVGWLPDFIHNLHEHWEKRIVNFDPGVQPSIGEFLKEFAREQSPTGGAGLLRKARQLMSVLVSGGEEKADREELDAFQREHPRLCRDPREYIDRGQIFLSFEPDDPAPSWLPDAMGEAGRRVCGLAVDYGHWDATLEGCVTAVSDNPSIDPEYAARLLATNALDFYGERLRRRIGQSVAESTPTCVELAS